MPNATAKKKTRSLRKLTLEDMLKQAGGNRRLINVLKRSPAVIKKIVEKHMPPADLQVTFNCIGGETLRRLDATYGSIHCHGVDHRECVMDWPTEKGEYTITFAHSLRGHRKYLSTAQRSRLISPVMLVLWVREQRAHGPGFQRKDIPLEKILCRYETFIQVEEYPRIAVASGAGDEGVPCFIEKTK